MVAIIKNFLEEFKEKPLLGGLLLIITLVIIIILLILLIYLPIIPDAKGAVNKHIIKNENSENNEIIANQISTNHDKEKVATLVHNDVIKDIDHMEFLIKDIRQSIYTAEETDKKVIAGINDNLEKWNISVYKNNAYHLTYEDTVVITNKEYGKHQPSAIFKVVEVVEKGKTSERNAEIFMSSTSADFLDIPNANYIGMFNVTLRVLPKH